MGGLLLAAGSAVSLALVSTVFLTWPAGQRIDETALTGAVIGRGHIREGALSLLQLVSVVGLALATVAIVVLACLRRRLDLAVGAVVIVAGSNVTTQVLKYAVLDRPDVGVETRLVNSLPSGHTTVAVSLAVALVLVTAAGVRALAALIGTAVATAMGVATLALGWHRPSDAVAAVFVVGVWAGLVAAAGGLRRRREPSAPLGTAVSVGLLVTCGAALLAAAGLALWWTSRLPAIPTDRLDLFVAYAGGAAGIGGTTALLLAATVVLVRAPGADSSMPATTSDSSVSAKVGGE